MRSEKTVLDEIERKRDQIGLLNSIVGKMEGSFGPERSGKILAACQEESEKLGREIDALTWVCSARVSGNNGESEE